MDLKTEYEAVTSERKGIIKEINTLEQNEIVKKYIELHDKNIDLKNQQTKLYKKMKNEEYSTCNHIWIYSFVDYDNDSLKYKSCIKCGLNEEILPLFYAYQKELLSFDDRIMYEYMKNNNYNKGINSNICCDFDLAKSIYSKIKENHPNIDDKTALKYFEVALDDIRNIKVNEDRKISRAKRLSLDIKFNKWNE